MKSETHNRAVQAFPNPFKYKIFIAYCYSNRIGKTVAAKNIFNHFFDSMPKDKQAELMRLYDQMSEEQRKNPKAGVTIEELRAMSFERRKMSINDVCELFGISRGAISNWRKNNLLPFVRDERGKVYFDSADVARVIQEKLF